MSMTTIFLLLFLLALPLNDARIVRILEQGETFQRPKVGDTVRVHYEGYVTVAGKGERKFDSSRERDRPLDFVLGKKKVIKCWERDIPEVFLDSRVIISNLSLVFVCFSHRGWQWLSESDRNARNYKVMISEILSRTRIWPQVFIALVWWTCAGRS